MRALALAALLCSAVVCEVLLPALGHAAKAAARGGCAVGVCGTDAVVLAAAPQAPTDLVLDYPSRRLFLLDELGHNAIVAVGVAADSRMVVELARRKCAEHAALFRSPLPTPRLAAAVADAASQAARGAAPRPFGVDVLVVRLRARRALPSRAPPRRRRSRATRRDAATARRQAGFDSAGAPVLYHVDPRGHCRRLRAAGVGGLGAATTEHLASTLEALDASGRGALDASGRGAEITPDGATDLARGALDAAFVKDDAALQMHACDVEVLVLRRPEAN
ncbi:nucleophile aminohydrolase [Pelagophyceae sp. CCMP2097]|nr:nucleophile aminohydrolase [Pelagophyceae sp. CCMP2097]